MSTSEIAQPLLDSIVNMSATSVDIPKSDDSGPIIEAKLSSDTPDTSTEFLAEIANNNSPPKVFTISSGGSIESMKGLAKIPISDKVQTLENLRAELKNRKYMVSPDRFISSDGYGVDVADEVTLEWKDIFEDGKINILSAAAAAEKARASKPEEPEDPVDPEGPEPEDPASGDNPEIPGETGKEKPTEPTTGPPGKPGKLPVPSLPEKHVFVKPTMPTPIAQPGTKIERPVAGGPTIEPPSNIRTLKDDQLLELFDINGLLSGALTNGSGASRYCHAIFETPKIKVLKDMSMTADNAETRVVQTFTASEASMIRQGFSSASLSIQSAFVAANVEGSRETTRIKAERENKTYVTGVHHYSRAVIKFKIDDLKAKAAFFTDATKALQPASDDEKRQKLKEFFKVYGDVFPTRVHLGGLLHTTREVSSRNQEELDKVEQNLRAKLDAVIKGVPVSVGGQTGSSSETGGKTGYSEITDNIEGVGGDTLLVTNGPKWIESVATYQNWRVCDLSDLILVESLLPQAQQAEIKRLALSAPAIEKPKKPLQGKWVPAQLHANSMLLPCKSGRLELYRPADVPSGWHWLGSTTSSTSALIVRANDGITDAFCPIAKYDKVWDDKGSIRDSGEIAFVGSLLGFRAGAYSLWAPYPQDASKYAAMTGGFVGDHAPRAQPQPPAHDSGLVCINKKYLAKAKKGEKIWSDKGSGSKLDGAVYDITPETKGIPMSTWWPGDYDGLRNVADGLYLIPEDSIEIVA